ncbi:putative RDD family membrane protein YckC [Kineococcus xinjiangensis]|uniref:Putative RDD family membrane protein YckC n=1 Tax=Kineococcus xinjiangensis TaxID=512762 RepID=A0A2S6IKG0_9ACTN|nr:RDD family protein [Kineococcus xinjiangensis]PPK94640.1 putative RDD family membrane protein YckC [Kineococcus xinjiangensis]
MVDTRRPSPQPLAAAPFWRRLTARVIDLLLALPLTFLLIVPLSIVASPVYIPMDKNSAAYDTVVAVMGTTAYFLAYVLLEWFLLVRRDGQTLGKGLLGLRVVSDRGGATLTVTSSFVRLLVLFAPFVLLSAAGNDETGDVWDTLSDVGLLTVLASLLMALVPAARRRAVHDLAAGSRVVRAPVRGIALKQDVRMMIPGKVDLTKR